MTSEAETVTTNPEGPEAPVEGQVGDQGLVTAGDPGGDPAPPDDPEPTETSPSAFLTEADLEPEDFGWYNCPSCGRVTPAGAVPTGPQVVKLEATEPGRRTQQQHGPCPTCLEVGVAAT